MGRLKALIRPVFDGARLWHQRLTLRRSVRLLCKDPVQAGKNRRLLQRLVYGWGNPSWSAGTDYLSACISEALNAQGPTLECGSGLSTLVLAATARSTGNEHWCLEHSEEWGRRLQTMLEVAGLDERTTLCVRPLKDYGSYTWYDPPLESMTSPFHLVVCDGPPGDTPGGRYGLIPVMREALSDKCVILLDDAHREEEKTIAKRWVREVDGRMQILGLDDQYIRISMTAQE